MIEFIKCNYADEEYLKKHKIFSTADVYFIIKNNERCGAIEYRETYEFSLKIEYLLVFSEFQGNGIGTATVRHLQSLFPAHEIYGEAIPTDATIAFWDSLDAEFEMEEEMEYYKSSKECIPFTIH